MRFKILGSLEVLAGEEPIPLGGLHQRAVLGYLLLNPNKAVATSNIIRAVWGHDAPPTCRKMVQNAVSGLRRILAPAPDVALLTRSPGYLLSIDPRQIDLPVFRALADEGRKHLAAEQWEPASVALRKALSLWRDPVLSDLAEEGIVWPEHDVVQNQRLTAFEDCMQAELALGRHWDLVGELERTFSCSPARERLSGQLMLALYRCGRQPEALAAYQRTRTALTEEFGLDPGRELRSLERAILTHAPELDLAGPAREETADAPSNLRWLSPRQRPLHAAPPPAPPPAATSAAAVSSAPSSSSVMVERKRVSVLLVRAQVPQTSGREDPEQADAVQKEVAAVVRNEVERFGGVLRTSVGANWLALFGVPKMHENDPERAVRAALAIRHRIATELAGNGVAPVALLRGCRLAVATGEVMVTYDSDDDSEPAEVMGQVFDRCQQLLAGAPPAGLRICDCTVKIGGDVFGAAWTNDPQQGWEIKRVEQPTPMSKVFFPFLGREREMEILTGLLGDTLRRRRPHLVTVIGEPGIGKTRLSGEFLRAVEDPDLSVPDLASRTCSVLIGRVSPFGGGHGVEPLVATVQAHAGIDASDSPIVADHKLVEAVHRLVGSGVPGAELLRGLRRCLAVGRQSAPLDRDTFDSVFAAWRQFIEEIAAQRPLVVVLEDIHLAGEALMDSVADVVEQLTTMPLMLLVTGRPELLQARPRWSCGKRDALILTLDPLPDRVTGYLMDTLVEGCTRGTLDPDLVARVGGNPLFAKEYVHALRAERNLERAPTPVPLPGTVQTVIAAHLDTLLPVQKAVLRDASVVGNTVWVSAVAALGNRDQDEVARHLAHLERKQLLHRRRPTSIPGEVEYAFRQPLVREVAYSQLPGKTRAAKQHLADDWLQEATAQRTVRATTDHRQSRAFGRKATRQPNVG
ncbi:BTAD domain-containing putative transcriptional regulator [Streptomyces sp. NPDC046465]|uniref:BTAD domain-containing putative transcriptional regulator n=1 Tax=Streptomyces sp. NPDC046465 TaxID=3155810 RepID=UPI0033CFC60A